MVWSPLERAPLADLLAERRGAVEELRAALQKPDGGQGDCAPVPALPGFADDVWLLRYTISFEDSGAAAAAARKALAWRQENGPLIEAARRRRPPDDFTAAEVRAIELFLTSAYHHTSRFGDPVFVSRMRGCNLRALMDAVSEAKLERWLNFVNECAWQYCEAASKDAGSFVKQINIQDVAAAAMVQEMRFFRALGSSSKTNEWLRPQFIGKTYILNPPSWVKFASRLAGSVMSPGAIAKIFVHPGSVPGTAPAGVDGARLCRFAREFLGDPARVPSFVGGTRDSNLVFPVSSRQDSPPEGDELRREPKVFTGLPRPPRVQQVDPEGPDDNASSTSFESCQSFATAEESQRSPRWQPAMPVPMSMDGGSVVGGATGRRCCLFRLCGRLFCGRRRQRHSGVVVGPAAPERLLDP